MLNFVRLILVLFFVLEEFKLFLISVFDIDEIESILLKV